MLGFAAAEVALIEHAFAAGGVEDEGGLALVQAFFGVLEDTVRAKGLAVEVGLQAVLHAIKDGYGAGGFRGCR